MLLWICLFASPILRVAICLWPHISDRSKKSCWFFSLFNFSLIVMMEWLLTNSLYVKLKTKSSHSFSSWYDGGAIFLLLRQHYLSIISDFSIVHILIKYQLSPAGSVLWMYLEFEYILPSLLSSETALTWLEQFSFLPVFLLRLLTDALNLKRSAGVTLSNC